MAWIEAVNIKTDLGWWHIEAVGGELTRIDLGTSPYTQAESGSLLMNTAARQLRAYFEGSSKKFSLPLAWGGISGFRRDVLEVVAGIPFGGLLTYGEIAKLIGKPGSGQAVGAAVGTNPWLIVVPCHRVVGAGGALHGFSAPGGVAVKQHLLDFESEQCAATAS